MHIALISDIHGHALALEAVLADIARQAVDQIICLGDVATLGPQPNEVLERLKGLGCPCIMGNHDAAILEPQAASAYQIAEPLISSIFWCADQLSPNDLEYLRSYQSLLPLKVSETISILFYHGSPQANIDLVTATTPADEMDRLFQGQRATVMVGGHTHIQMLRQYNGTLFVNPGSVGSAFVRPFSPGNQPELLPWAEYGLIRVTDGVLSVDLRRVPFDIEASCALATHSQLPMRSWWLEQYRQAIRFL